MRAVTLAAGLSLITTALAIPCVTQAYYYNPINKSDREMLVKMCWDTDTHTCKGDITFLDPDRGANRVSTCAHSNGKLEWHLGTGWTLFGIDLYSLDIVVNVADTDCTVTGYNTIFVKYIGLPLSLARTDDKPVWNSATCPF